MKNILFICIFCTLSFYCKAEGIVIGKIVHFRDGKEGDDKKAWIELIEGNGSYLSGRKYYFMAEGIKKEEIYELMSYSYKVIIYYHRERNDLITDKIIKISPRLHKVVEIH